MVDRTSVVTVFLQKNEDILLLYRSADVKTYRHRWAGVSGYLERKSTVHQALEEIYEETGLPPNKVRLQCEGVPVTVDDEKNEQYWLVYPFRFSRTEDSDIEIDREHNQYQWMNPGQIDNRQTVPGLRRAWERVR